MKEFYMMNFGWMGYFLGFKELQWPGGISICQKKYAQKVLERFNIAGCNAVFNPIVLRFKLVKDSVGMVVDKTL